MPHYTIENTSSAVILWEGEYESEAAALAALEAVAGVPEGGWGEDVVIHGGPLAPLKARDVAPLARVEAHLERIGVADTGQGGCVVNPGVSDYHVTSIRDGSVYGHSTGHCSFSGCSGHERFLGHDEQWEGLESGDLIVLEGEDLVEIADEGASGTYSARALLPLLAKLPTNWEERFENGPYETAARQAYYAFWQAITPAEA